MENKISEFEFEVHVPYSLNYLVFVQNIHLNRIREGRDAPFFPYMDTSTWGMKDAHFEESFKSIWKQALNKNVESQFYDHNGILERDQALYLQLFENSDKGRNGFAESVKSFLAWWNSICGKIAVESVFDHERMNRIYKELSTSIKENKRLRAALIYDAHTIAETSMKPWYAVVSLQEVYLYPSKPQLLLNLKKSCEENQ